jgi:hypothetical protein
MPSIINAATSGGLISTADTSGVLQLQTASTTALTISASQQVQVNTGGSAAAPVISKSDDTNTGIFFPAADTIAFAEGGVESMRIDSSGRVGIGCTPAPWDTFNALQVNGATLAGIPANQAIFGNNVYYASSAFKYVATGTLQVYQQGASGHFFYSAPSGSANASASVTTVMSVDLNKSLALQGASNQTGTGITFPATQSASSNANTLDDYEEGTFTATLKGTTTNPTTPVSTTGTYTKIGRVVYVQFFFNNISNVGAAGEVYIDGLPFAGTTTNPSQGSCASYLLSFGGAGRTSLSVQIASTSAYVFASGNDVAWGSLTHSAGTGRYFSVMAVYETT